MKEWYKLQITTYTSSFPVTLRLTKNKDCWGFYIPKTYYIGQKLAGETIQVVLKPSKDWQAAILTDKRVQIPYTVVEANNIQSDDLYEVELRVGSKVYREIIIITELDRKDRTNEYYFTIRLQEIPTGIPTLVRFTKKVERLRPDRFQGDNETLYLPNLFPDAAIGKIDSDKMIIFLGRHKPIITPITIRLPDFIHYFGCYYADGTKKGHAWAINASTPEQAVYYIRQYHFLVLNDNLVYDLTFTKKQIQIEKNDELKDRLIETWKNKANLIILKSKIYVLESQASQKIRKYNPLGSLRIRDNNGLVMKLHVRLLTKIQKHLLNHSTYSNCWLFLLGIMEGDGWAGGGRKRCRITITCHKSDEMIPKLFEDVGITPMRNYYRNAVNYSFGIVDILKNLTILDEMLFIYYPKRRIKFLSRLMKVESVKYLLNETQQLFPLALHPLKVNNLLDDSIIIKNLKKLQKEINSNN